LAVGIETCTHSQQAVNKSTTNPQYLHTLPWSLLYAATIDPQQIELVEFELDRQMLMLMPVAIKICLLLQPM